MLETRVAGGEAKRWKAMEISKDRRLEKLGEVGERDLNLIVIEL